MIGAILAIAGIAALADRTGGLRDVGRSVSAIAIALAGIGVIAAPALGRLLANLDTERTLRVREEERAALAAHLHDSVLQSLVLIQRADDPRRMVSLARRQERELRSWLYGAGTVGEPSSLTAAVESMAAAIEVDHEMRVEAVIVGDAPLDETARAFLGALGRQPRTRLGTRGQITSTSTSKRTSPSSPASSAIPASDSTRRRYLPTAMASPTPSSVASTGRVDVSW